MSNPVFDLQEMLAGKAPLAGMVVFIDGSLAQVATRKGVVEVAFAEGIKAGDRVAVRNGRAVRVQDVMDALVYFVWKRLRSSRESMRTQAARMKSLFVCQRSKWFPTAFESLRTYQTPGTVVLHPVTRTGTG
ncbi:MAG: hypothetical protein HQL84_16430 [Magnetococcales bacterium]|nr:hypothetical protein [Magnetococcales bacterium]MBF0151607.1 hypothetical protein [Magnetococcales bacterium]MBF0631729.1 hypothetical protein [Magnetococcales bacterium]